MLLHADGYSTLATRMVACSVETDGHVLAEMAVAVVSSYDLTEDASSEWMGSAVVLAERPEVYDAFVDVADATAVAIWPFGELWVVHTIRAVVRVYADLAARRAKAVDNSANSRLVVSVKIVMADLECVV